MFRTHITVLNSSKSFIKHEQDSSHLELLDDQTSNIVDLTNEPRFGVMGLYEDGIALNQSDYIN